MKKLTPLILLLISLPFAILAGGLSSFQEPTPYGNTVYYDGSAGAPITFHFGETSKASDTLSLKAAGTAFSDFYFYKGFLIAETDTTGTIINERDPEILFFKDKRLFSNYLNTHNLKPKIWTRWYNKNYDQANFKSFVFLAFFFFPVTLVLIGLAIYFLVSLKKTKTTGYKTFKKIYLIALITVAGLIFLLQTFPQSI